MYDNLLKALGAQSPSCGLSYEEQAANYALFSDLMKKGVKLQDLVDRASAPKDPPMDGALFSVMEDAVSGDPEVESARKAQDDVLKAVLMRLADEDPAYREAKKRYRDAVVNAYTAAKEVSRGEMTKGPGKDAEVMTPRDPKEGKRI